MQRGLAALDLAVLPRAGSRLPMLQAIRLPEGADEAALRTRLLAEHGIEVGAGLGELKGKVIRVGLMGHNATLRNVRTFLVALEECLRAQHLPVPAASSIAATYEAS